MKKGRWHAELVAGAWRVTDGSAQKTFFGAAQLTKLEAELVATKLNKLERLTRLAWEA